MTTPPRHVRILIWAANRLPGLLRVPAIWLMLHTRWFREAVLVPAAVRAITQTLEHAGALLSDEQRTRIGVGALRACGLKAAPIPATLESKTTFRWALPTLAHKYHAFRAGTSLCGRYTDNPAWPVNLMQSGYDVLCQCGKCSELLDREGGER